MRVTSSFLSPATRVNLAVLFVAASVQTLSAIIFCLDSVAKFSNPVHVVHVRCRQANNHQWLPQQRPSAGQRQRHFLPNLTEVAKLCGDLPSHSQQDASDLTAEIFRCDAQAPSADYVFVIHCGGQSFVREEVL